MSLYFIKQTLQSLKKDYGTNGITLTKYTVGQVDYTTANPSNSVTSITVGGIVLPKSLNVSFLPKTTLSADKKTREFIINDPRCTEDWVKEGNYLTYLGERYNIKMSDYVEGYYYFVRATAIGDEPASQNNDKNQGLAIAQQHTVEVI